MAPIAVTLYTRPNCSLCEQAKAVIQGSRLPVALTEVDIDGDAALRELYTNDVPVIHIEGREAFRHSVDAEAFAHYIQALRNGWHIVASHHLEKEFTFPDFAAALAFTNRIGAIAEQQNHHPDIFLAWGKVRVTTWSHDANRLTSRDFRLAVSIDQTYG